MSAMNRYSFRLKPGATLPDIAETPRFTPESAADLYESLEQIAALEYSHKSSFKCFVKAVDIARAALKKARAI